MPIDPDVQEVIDYLGSLPVINAANSTLDELRLHKEEIESRYDLPEISMYQERSLDIPGPKWFGACQIILAAQARAR